MRVEDVRKLAGYVELKQACAEMNVCLGYPVVNRKPEDRFGSIRIYPKLPYAASEDVFLDKTGLNLF